MKKKTLISVPDFNKLGGVAVSFRVLSQVKEDSISYFHFNGYEKLPKIIVAGLKVIEFLLRVPFYDIVHFNPSFNKSALRRDFAFIKLAKFFNKKVIIFIHGWSLPYEVYLNENTEERNEIVRQLNLVDHFFILGKVFKEKLWNMGVSKNITMSITSSVADIEENTCHHIQDKVKSCHNKQNWKFLFLSRLEPDKGAEIAIYAFDKVQKKFKDKRMTLYVAGDGSMKEELEYLVKSKDIKNIIFPGYVKEDKKYVLFKESDIFIFPTCYGEGLPTVILEAMFYGLPIISRVNAGIPDVVLVGENGYLTKSTDFIVFSEFMEKYILNIDEFKRTIRNNHDKAIKSFTKESVLERHLNIYNSI